MGLRPTVEVPPRALTTRVMELRPTHFVHVSPINQKVPIILISYNSQSYNSCFPIHTQWSNISFTSQPHILIKAPSLKLF